MRHGRGQMAYANGDKYFGEYARDCFEGFGVFQWAPFEDDETHETVAGKRYEGDWMNGKKHGQGVFLMGDGNVYSGGFEKDMYHHKGTLRCRNGDIFNGEWARGKADGKQHVMLHNEDVYTGMMKAHMYHGKGKYEYNNNTGWYDGEWQRGLRHGKGVRLFSNGNKYIGAFSEGEMEGEGIMLYANGDQYVGEWAHGHPQGQGVMKYAHGETYEGSWLSGFIFGQGKYVYTDGGYYEGEFKKMKPNKANGIEFPHPDGKRNGLGIRVWANGSRYEGNWEDDKMSGDGNYTGVTGCRYIGTFWNGSKHGKGMEEFGNVLGIKYTCPAGNRHPGLGYCKYDGDWERGYFHGKGAFECVDGRGYQGDFYDGKRHGKGACTYLKEGEAGDPDNLFIGGTGSLYRFDRYDGEWFEGWREGEGNLWYVNGDRLSGPFRHGQPHGIIRVTFGTTRKTRRCKYVRGTRESWLSDGPSRVSLLSNMMSPSKKPGSPGGNSRAASPAAAGSILAIEG